MITETYLIQSFGQDFCCQMAAQGFYGKFIPLESRDLSYSDGISSVPGDLLDFHFHIAVSTSNRLIGGSFSQFSIAS